MCPDRRNVPGRNEAAWFAVAAVDLLESLLTASIVDQMTDTRSDKNRGSIDQGIANIASGFFGGMAGCAVIGQSVINVKSGGRTRLSTFIADPFLLFLLMALGDLVGLIPIPALVAIMIMVSIGTFSWSSLNDLRFHPRRFSLVMLATVITVVATHNLALGVGIGVLLSGIFFAWKVAQIFRVTSTLSDDGRQRSYRIEGQIFFASAEEFLDAFNFAEPLDGVTIDVSRAHIWDLTGVTAIDKTVLKFRKSGVDVDVVGLNEASATIMDKLAMHDRPDAMEKVLGHSTHSGSASQAPARVKTLV